MKIKTAADNLMRDTSNHALLNTDKQAYLLYKRQRKEEISVSSLQHEVGQLKTDIADIKSMLQQILNRE